MSVWSATLYTSATLTVNGNSGYLPWPAPAFDPGIPRLFQPSRAFLRMEPANLATDETMAVTLALAFNSDGDGSFDAHVFTTVTSTNVAENLILPGEDSAGILFVATTEAATAPIPAFWKLTWVLVGTTKSMNFVMYASLED